MKPAIEAAVFEMEAAKAGLINYVETNEGATDESNQEYHKKRVTHLDAVSAVNQLRAKKTHDETKGLHVFGVTVLFPIWSATGY